MHKKIRTLVVDDEPYNREELIFLLNQYPIIEVVAEADSGESCIVKATQTQPDLVFLDIEMPGIEGMKAAELLGELKNPPLVVFATAYPQFAAQAFRLDAIDYLLKPYDEDELTETIARIEKRLFYTSEIDEQKSVHKLAVDMDGEVVYLDPFDIIYIHSENKQVRIVTNQQDIPSKGSLKELEARLSTFPFFRIHKSYLVNLDYVSKLTPWFNGAYNLNLHGRKESLPVSRNYIKFLRGKLEL
ncbi:LytR/AlgR family response regulator transcription factor [Oceanobacillus saliphilus]|uniref:LytR/AlgR family response regulator transcription factor n=1 Tax=Oceanobacillus saliphilus TaxID=2925834 RepID=UPI00201DE0AB